MYWDDRYGTETVSQEVLGLMKQLMMQDTNSAVSNSFLLDDDSSIPFSVEAISTAMKDTNIPSLLNNATFPQPLLKHPSFAFLTEAVADATAAAAGGGGGSVGA